MVVLPITATTETCLLRKYGTEGCHKTGAQDSKVTLLSFKKTKHTHHVSDRKVQRMQQHKAALCNSRLAIWQVGMHVFRCMWQGREGFCKEKNKMVSYSLSWFLVALYRQRQQLTSERVGKTIHQSYCALSIVTHVDQCWGLKRMGTSHCVFKTGSMIK